MNLSEEVTHAISLSTSELYFLFLVAIFTQRPQTLKSDHTTSYKEILSFTSMRAITDYLANTRVKKLLSNNNIDDVADQLQKLFAIDISSCNDFNVIREAFYRRHVVVHNKGITDKNIAKRYPTHKLVLNFQRITNIYQPYLLQSVNS
jgi:hypothetical protein